MSDERKIRSSFMSGAELYALRAAGYEPLAAIVGVAAMSMGTRGMFRSVQGIFKKGELNAVTLTSQEARRKAIERVEDEGVRLGADLVIIHETEIENAAEIVEATCHATACRKSGNFTPMPIATATS